MYRFNEDVQRNQYKTCWRHDAKFQPYSVYVGISEKNKLAMERDRRVARLGGNGGQMGEDIPLNNYIKSAEHYLACGVSYAGHLANICQSNHEGILTARKWILFVNISMLKTPSCNKDKQLFEHMKLALYDAKETLDKTERRIESIKSK